MPFYYHAFGMIGPPQQRPSITVSEKQHTIFFILSRTQELYQIVLQSLTLIPLFIIFHPSSFCSTPGSTRISAANILGQRYVHSAISGDCHLCISSNLC
jgi:hypothetical protein